MIKRNSWIIFHNFVQTCSSIIRNSTIHGGFEKESNKSGGLIVDQQHSTKRILILIFIDPNLLLILKSDHNNIIIIMLLYNINLIPLFIKLLLLPNFQCITLLVFRCMMLCDCRHVVYVMLCVDIVASSTRRKLLTAETRSITI